MNTYKIVITDNESGEVLLNKDSDCIFGIAAHDLNEDECEIREMVFTNTTRAIYMKVLQMAMKRSQKLMGNLMMDFVKSMPDMVGDEDEDLADEE